MNIVTEFRQRLAAETATEINRGTPNPPHRSKALGPNQLAWLRDKVGIFETCERHVLASDAHRAEMRAKAGLS